MKILTKIWNRIMKEIWIIILASLAHTCLRHCAHEDWCIYISGKSPLPKLLKRRCYIIYYLKEVIVKPGGCQPKAGVCLGSCNHFCTDVSMRVCIYIQVIKNYSHGWITVLLELRILHVQNERYIWVVIVIILNYLLSLQLLSKQLQWNCSHHVLKTLLYRNIVAR